VCLCPTPASARGTPGQDRTLQATTAAHGTQVSHCAGNLRIGSFMKLTAASATCSRKGMCGRTARTSPSPPWVPFMFHLLHICLFLSGGKSALSLGCSRPLWLCLFSCLSFSHTLSVCVSVCLAACISLSFTVSLLCLCLFLSV
jgi:hypothetical protein